MKKHRVVIITLAAVMAIAVPVAAAQSPAFAGAVRHPRVTLMRLARNFAFRIRQGVRSHEITPAERDQLKSELLAVRSEIQGIRLAGVPPTDAQKSAVRAELQKIHRDIYTARHGELSRQP